MAQCTDRALHGADAEQHHTHTRAGRMLPADESLLDRGPRIAGTRRLDTRPDHTGDGRAPQLPRSRRAKATR